MSAREPRGQATVEYALIVTVLLLGSLAVLVTFPYTSRLFNALQAYLDVMFYALNVAVG